MKAVRTITSSLTCLTAAVLLSGCASTGYQRADKTGESIANFHNEVVNLKKAVDGSMANLSLTTEAAASDPRNAFNTFSKSVDRVQDARARCAKRATEVKAQGNAYFKQWEQQLAQINDPDIRQVAQARKAKLNEIFSKVGPALEQAKADFDPFLVNLKELRTFLSLDLTVAGVDSARPIIEKTRESGVKIQESLDTLLAEMNAISATLTAAKVPPPAK